MSLVCGVLVFAVHCSSAFALTWGTGVEAVPPANVGAQPVVNLWSISCASAGNCLAIGGYHDSSGDGLGMLLTESSGMWGPGVEVALPPNAGSPNPQVYLSSVSCPSVGSCSAVGTYKDIMGDTQGLLLTETAGSWARGIETTLPADAASTKDPKVVINQVSCPSAGNCSAVGEYADNSGNLHGLLLDEVAGAWAAPDEADLPLTGGSNPDVTSVSCASVGNCSAVGEYQDGSSHLQGLLLTETAGAWERGIEAKLPANQDSDPDVNILAVSCASVGNCSATGYYSGGSSTDAGLLLTETAGMWGTGIEATLPANAASSPFAFLQSLSCGSAGNCSAVGNYSNSSHVTQAVLLNETAGTWSPGVNPDLPAKANSDQNASLDSVSCTSAGNCIAGGSYADSSGNGQGLLLSETSGTWTQGLEVGLPAGPASNPDAGITSVSCASAGNCAAAGGYSDSGNHGQGLLLDTQHQLAVSSAGTGGGTVTSTDGAIDCGPTCSHTYAEGSVATLIAGAAPGSVFAGWSGGGCPGAGTCTVTMNSDQAVTATFNAPAPPATAPPTLSALRVSPTKFVLAGRRVNGRCVKATRENSKAKRCRRPLKLKIRYQLSSTASVTLTISRLLSGRTVGGRCVKATRKNRKHRACTRLAVVRTASVSGTPGLNSFAITANKLNPGKYRLTARPFANGQTGGPRTATLTISG